MVFRKVFKPLYSEQTQKDEVREMLIASANYPYSLSSQEDNITDFTYAKIISPVGTTRRKRRLDNLTPDEKLLRKKLKNREAAQTSRDKKKAYITNLELTVKTLREQNELLQKKLDILGREKEELRMRNERLEKELKKEQICSISSPASHVIASGPAAPVNVPLQRDHPVLHVVTTVVLFLLLISSLLLLHLLLLQTTFNHQKNPALWIWTISIGLITLQIHRIWKNLKKLPIHYLKRLRNWRLKCPRMKSWWGPGQKCWNPPMRLQRLAVLLL